MRDENFKKTEKALYNHYEYLKEIDGIGRELELLEKQYKLIDERLKSNGYILQEESSAMNFEERVQTSTTGISYAENQLIKFAEEDIKEQNYISERIDKLYRKRRKLERNTVSLQYNIEMLGEEYTRFVELKYRDKIPMEIISVEMNMARSNSFKLRDKVVQDVARYLNILDKVWVDKISNEVIDND